MAQQVGEYVNSLNQETIRLYFTSVINNLDDAKIQMNTIVGDESNIYNSLTTSILQPADQSIKSLDTIPSIAESVQSSNKSFEQSVLNFKTSTTDLLKANAESLLGQTDSISKYKAVQSQVANHNAQVAGNSSKNQYDKDNNLYQNLYNSTNDSLNIFGNTEMPTDPNIPPSYLVQLSQRIDNYNQRITGFQTQVTQTQTELTALKTSLEGSRTQIAQNYFDGTIVDTSTLGDNESDITKAVSAGVDTNSVREALAKQVVSTLSSSDRLPGDYDNQVNSTIASISVNPADYASLFTKLKELGALTDAQIASYNSKLNLLTQYASVKGSTTGSMPGYTFITVANDVLPSTDSKTVTLDNVYPEVTTEKSGTNKYNATPISVANVQVHGAKSATVVPSTATISDPTPIQLQIQYTPDYGLNTISFDLQVGSEKIPMQYSFFYDKNKGSEALIHSDLSTVFEQLSRIDTAATTVKNIYGSPSSSYAVDVANPAGDSIAKMYGNISATSVADKLQQKDVDQYRKSGIDLYVKLSMQINQLQAQIDSLPQLQGAELPNNYFTASIEDLTKWYQAASAKLKQEYEEWQKNGPELIEVSATNSGDGLATNKIYTTDESSDGLLDIVTRLASSTKNTSETINSNGSVIGSMETQFNSLSEQSKKVQEEVKQVHQQTETLIKNQSKNIEESTEFNKNFQGVLSNARSNGTDNQAVLNFLAKPIVTEKTNQSSVLSTTPIWAYLLVILLLTNIATGLMIREYSRQKRDEAAEKAEEEHFE